jgi:putative ATP-dependent endonuclease of the OLD family
MYLDELKIWNFRKFGSNRPVFADDGKLNEPDLHIRFRKGLNLIVGENDSGKSSILEAIKYVCKSNSQEWQKIAEEDFHGISYRLRIECIFRGFASADVASKFSEWLGREVVNGASSPVLRLNLDVQRTDERVLPADVKGGADDIGNVLDAKVKELLQITFLKALRDVNSELIPRKNSRLSKILLSHKAFKGKNDTHHLTNVLAGLSREIDRYFENDGTAIPDNNGRELKAKIDLFLKEFFPISNPASSKFAITGQHVRGMLESLKLSLIDGNSGLGSNNLLFIAAELLLLQEDPWNGLRLGLIEEIEAHLHPQAQLRVIDYLQTESLSNDYQLLLTTHSPNLASKIELENLIVCTSNGKAFSMGSGFTHLDDARDDYKFLRRFLDSTKANLFFAKGVLLVEGYAEAILFPVLADKLGKSLTKSGVSIVNVGSAAFLRYGKIFLRKDGKVMPTKVSIVTDLDLRPTLYSKARKREKRRKALVVDAFTDAEIEAKRNMRKIESETVKTYFSPHWTLEYCLALSTTLRKAFYLAVLNAWKEKKRAQGIRTTKSIDKKIAEIDDQFNRWGDNDLQIAFEIYNNTILKQQLSKAAIAQYFAEMIEAGLAVIDPAEPQIKYLIDAVNHVTTV